MCALGFPLPLSLPNLNPPPPKRIISCRHLLLLDMAWIVALCFYEIIPNMLLFAIAGSRSGPSTADAGPTTTTQTSTTSTRGMPNSTRRQSVSTANTQQRSNKTWREAQLCSGSHHLSGHVHCFSLDFV